MQYNPNDPADLELAVLAWESELEEAILSGATEEELAAIRANLEAARRNQDG
jgi:hypothetical protein